MIVLTIVLSGAFASTHVGPISWMVILATIWLPGIAILTLVPFSQWNDPGKDRDEA